MKSDEYTKKHWEEVYTGKSDEEVSWFEGKPSTSLDIIASLDLPKDSSIIDIGGGNSNLISHLLENGYNNLSILDISENALQRTKSKLGKSAAKVQWINSDILNFEPTQDFELWHDRATFHFFTREEDILKYIDILGRSLKTGAYFILATFSTTGPKRCSGLEITQYSPEKLKELFKVDFTLLESFEKIHKTPFKTEQNFIYNLFQKK
ncbi:class I SAM-dependent methyltransferase [Muricauda sp. 334s03]|jgi:ubiquinone/menaquinone biosynthesis C-methylase UbiE|uniref:Class I SAM-dependent methyltransferase n=1 Tax=Flagellimonas yonaguniensis TaxID=3031325 RepID=A0ABT5XZP2_9FLAO|nr:class I SAM-dependent methyltransferase [[Muricauda] yonaguniensis]MDF0716664.1 class I SAM-dependent methyltransferase [[Muricauda] yonaguniensis]